jgi:hypothetical protein
MQWRAHSLSLNRINLRLGRLSMKWSMAKGEFEVAAIQLGKEGHRTVQDLRSVVVGA